MAVTSVSTLRPGRDPPTRPPRHTSWLTRLSSPRRTMSVAGTISPASATRFGSSKITSAPSIARDTELTESASWFGNNSDVEHRYFPKHGGTFRGCAGSVQLFNRWIEAKVDGDGTAVPDRSDGRSGLLVASRTNHPPLGRDVPLSRCCWKNSADDARRRLVPSQAKSPVLPKLLRTSGQAVDPSGHCHCTGAPSTARPIQDEVAIHV